MNCPYHVDEGLAYPLLCHRHSAMVKHAVAVGLRRESSDEEALHPHICNSHVGLDTNP